MLSHEHSQALDGGDCLTNSENEGVEVKSNKARVKKIYGHRTGVARARHVIEPYEEGAPTNSDLIQV